MLTYKKSNQLQFINYSNFTSYQDDKKSTAGFVFIMAGLAIS